MNGYGCCTFPVNAKFFRFYWGKKARTFTLWFVLRRLSWYMFGLWKSDLVTWYLF